MEEGGARVTATYRCPSPLPRPAQPAQATCNLSLRPSGQQGPAQVSLLKRWRSSPTKESAHRDLPCPPTRGGPAGSQMGWHLWITYLWVTCGSPVDYLWVTCGLPVDWGLYRHCHLPRSLGTANSKVQVVPVNHDGDSPTPRPVTAQTHEALIQRYQGVGEGGGPHPLLSVKPYLE